MDEATNQQNHHERLASVEVDVRHLDNRLDSLSREMREGFASLRAALSAQRQPLTAFAGWAAVILTLVFAFGAPLKQADERHRRVLDDVLGRELEDSYFRGQSDQRFSTLQADIAGAIANRKDLDSKHEAAQRALSERIDEVQHSLDNGLGRRISEMTLPLSERLRALEREVFGR